ncbi:thiol-disulfide isomerase-like thioredoxin [Aequorivita sublithincola DSM 14238]|uniref:Thiol-disulfide isomerase-like thioredoxin n=1 Tax=Aequorivita sublithincola (strain DSM 14238 / LMG 21431 / ACAM 643 / 9-3) TaxID=746697 RepID=I3YS46_AEQSU|nr:TlpA disulfide reductase family protein [Aequorivita sublithincola]AFL79814.1 thiol-disulfide isomerase-like thioredoxin [Aequorivita sublithincola DSM 14238]
MNFLKKHWSNILFFAFIALLIFPQTRMPIQVFVQRLVSFSPSETAETNRESLKDYNWSLLKLNSEEVSFSQSEGKVTIVNFWATWCPPCVAEMPSFQKLYDSYGDKVDFYFVTSEKAEKIQSFMEKQDYTLPVFRQIFDAPEALHSQALPTTYLISKTGEIIINEEGAADWNSEKMHKLLDELLKE